MHVVSPPSRYRRIAWIEPSRLPFGYDDQNIYSGILFPRAGPKMAAVLKAQGYEVEVISGETSPIDPDEIAEHFDLVCISVLSNTAPHGLILGRWLVERGLPVVMGGFQFAHTAFTPEALAPTTQALDFVPYVVRGEGYLALPQLLAALETGGEMKHVGGLSYRDAGGRIIHNPTAPLLSREYLNNLPPQDWSVVRDRDKMMVLPVQGMTGCPRQCSWCAVWPRDGRLDRTVDPQRFVDEMETCLGQNDFSHAFFSSDNFPALHKWALAVCQEIVKRGIHIHWSCQAEVGAVRHTELMETMIAAGCERWCLGLESINPASLEGSNKRQSRETMENAITELHRHGLAVHGMFIVGLPFDTPETVRTTAKWARRTGIETVQFLCLVDLPGSVDYEQQDLAHVAFQPFVDAYAPLNWMFVTGHYARLSNENLSLAQVQDIMMEAMRAFYTLPRALAPFFTLNWAAVKAARARGASWLASLRAAVKANVICGALRLRGWVQTRRWLKSEFNQTYLQMLRTEPGMQEPLRQRLLEHLPEEWLRTLERVDAERRGRTSEQLLMADLA
jgi:radical SAM superfamily enzyme YgiQ (UPF0313 family)